VAKLSEEKELQTITKRFSDAVSAFTRRDFPAAHQQFTEIVESYKDSEHYSVLEITGRSNVYLRMVDAQLNPQKIELKSAEDLLNEAIYQMNAGQVDRALTLFADLNKKQGKDPYVDYLMAIALHRKGEVEESLALLKQCIDQDAHFKVMAFNEPDFEPLLDNRDFRDLVS